MTTMHSHTPFSGSVSQRFASADGEASGLIDIRTMGAVLAASEPHAEVPSFGGLTLAPLLVTPQPPVRPVTGGVAAVPRSQTPMLTLLGVLTLGVLGLAGYVVTLPAPQAAPPVVHMIAPTVVASAEPRDDEDGPIAARMGAAEEAEEVMPSDEPGKPAKERKQAPRKGVKAVPAGAASAAAPVEKAAAPTIEAPKPRADYGVDCLLGKASCSDKPADKAAAPVEKTAAPSDLPEKLEQADISAGTSAARASAASSCAKLAKGGEKVQVKLSIAGPTGSVVGASALEDAGNATLAACVVGELKQASFRKVQKQQMGTVVTVKF